MNKTHKRYTIKSSNPKVSRFRGYYDLPGITGFSIEYDRNIDQNILEELKSALQLYSDTYASVINDRDKLYAKENEVRTGSDISNPKQAYIMEHGNLVLDTKLLEMFRLREAGLQTCTERDRESKYFKQQYESLQSFHKDPRFTELDKNETELDNLLSKLKKISREKKSQLKHGNISIDDNRDLDPEEIKRFKSLVFEIKHIKQELAQDGCNLIQWGPDEFADDCDSEIINRLRRDNKLHWNTISEQPFSPEAVPRPDQKQPVLGPRGSDYDLYKRCNRYFIAGGKEDVLTSDRLTRGLLGPCNNLVEWTALLNRFSTLCSYYKNVPFIRFILPKGLVMPHRRYESEMIDEKKVIAVLKIGNFKFKIIPRKDPIYDKFRRSTYHFDMYNHQNDPILVPLLRSNITVTYTEFRDLVCYLDLPVFRSIYHPDLLFMPTHQTQEKMSEMDTETKKNYLQKLEIMPVDYECMEIDFDGRGKKYIFLLDKHENYPKSKGFRDASGNELLYNDVILAHAQDRLERELGQLQPIIPKQRGGKEERMSIGLYHENITSEFYRDYMEKYAKFNSMFDAPNEEKIFTFYLNDYEYIMPQAWSKEDKYRIEKTRYKLFKLKDFLSNESTSIIMYHPLLDRFFHNYETVLNFKLIPTKRNIKILEIANNPSSLEACHFFEGKYKGGQSDYSLHFFQKYSPRALQDPAKSKQFLDYYSQYIKMKISKMDSNFNKSMFENTSPEFDLIFANIYYTPTDLTLQLADLLNLRLYIYQLYYSLLRLKPGGHMVFPVMKIVNKSIADLVLLISDYFGKYHLYEWEVQNKYKFSYAVVVFKKFKGGCIEKLKNIFEAQFEKDPSGIHIRFPKDIRDKLFLQQSKYLIDEQYLAKDTTDINFPKDILDADITDPIYEDINIFNKKVFFSKSTHLTKLINLKNMDLQKQNKTIKKYRRIQLMNASLYAKKYDFKTVPLNENIFDSELGKMIIRDMYSYYNPISFTFRKYGDEDDLRDLSDELEKHKRDLFMTDFLIDTRNIEDWDEMKKVVRFYRSTDKNSHLKSIVENRYNQKNISQAWLKIYEILEEFQLIPKEKDKFVSFHMCEAPGNFVSATNHYIKTKTKIKEFDWYAQTLNPKTPNQRRALPDQYGYIKNYPKKWIFGEDGTGNILKIKNIKWYQKFMLDRGVELITSDCGIPERFGFDEVTKLHSAQLIFILNNLSEKGNCVAKVKFPIVYPLQVELYYLCYQSFEKLSFYKGNMNPSSKEFYLIGENYNRMSRAELNQLLNRLYFYEPNKVIRKYPLSFLSQLENINAQLVNNYIFNFERKLFYVDNYKTIDSGHFQNLMKLIQDKNTDWLKENKIQEIDDKDKL